MGFVWFRFEENPQEPGFYIQRTGVPADVPKSNQVWDSASVVVAACIDMAEWVPLLPGEMVTIATIIIFFLEQVVQPSFIRIFVNQC